MKLNKAKIKEYIQSILIALVLALLIKVSLVEATLIFSGSMENTLFAKDRVFVNKFIYGSQIPLTGFNINYPFKVSVPTYRLPRIHMPKRGDIVVFHPPIGGNKDFIKRVIAVANETIEIRDKRVFINGRILSEPYKFISNPEEIYSANLSPRDNYGPYKIPEGGLFVMGDNRDRSYDSRFFGFVSLDSIRGKAFFVYWPLTRWMYFD